MILTDVGYHVKALCFIYSQRLLNYTQRKKLSIFCSKTIEHIWDMLGRRMQAREPPVQNIRQLEATLHRELQQLSQQDIRRLTGGMRGSRACIRRPNMSQICSMGFKSGLMAGQGTEVTASLWR
jgi:hypothetical protein